MTARKRKRSRVRPPGRRAGHATGPYLRRGEEERAHGKREPAVEPAELRREHVVRHGLKEEQLGEMQQVELVVGLEKALLLKLLAQLAEIAVDRRDLEKKGK